MSIIKKSVFHLFILFSVFISYQCPVNAQIPQAEQMQGVLLDLIEPAEGSTVMSKKPRIRFFIPVDFAYQELIVLLDGIDVTNILNKKGEEFVLRPVGILSSGPHNLQVIVYTNDGNQHMKEAVFNTRHSEMFEEAYSNNGVGVSYRYRVEETDNVTNVPQYQLNTDLNSVTRIKEGNFDSTLNFNMRYLNQDMPIDPPEERFNLANYHFESNYVQNDILFHTEIGDVNIDESSKTVQGLSRRGGVFSTEYNGYSLNAFSVRSDEVFGFYGGTGIGGSINDHIIGGSIGGRFFSDRLSLKAIYAKGGDEGQSYNEFTAETVDSQTEGNVYGFVLCAELFDGLANIEAEYASSDYDPDTSDEFSSDRDKAYRVSISGYYDVFSWGLLYDYTGSDFQVVGSYEDGDLETIQMNGAANFDINSFDVSLTQYTDNVEEDDLFAQNITTDIALNYLFTKFENITISAGYNRSAQETDNEPTPTDRVKMNTDTYSGNICYNFWKMALTLDASHSYQDDKVDVYDTNTRTYTITPALSFDHVRLGPSFSYNKNEDKSKDIDTDTYTVAFSLDGDTFWENIIYNAYGSFDRTSTSDGLLDMRTFDTNFSVDYCIPGRLWVFEQSTVELEGRYHWTNDEIVNDKDHERVIFLKFSTAFTISF